MLMLWMLALVLLVYWDLRSVVHHWQRQTARYSELRALQGTVDSLEERVRATENRVANAEGNIKTASALSVRHTDNVRADLSASLSQHVEIFRRLLLSIQRTARSDGATANGRSAGTAWLSPHVHPSHVGKADGTQGPLFTGKGTVKRINVRLFEMGHADFAKLPASVAVDHVCIAHCQPLTLVSKATNEEKSFDLAKLYLISGDNILVDNSRAVRDAFGLWSAPDTGKLAALSSASQADGGA